MSYWHDDRLERNYGTARGGRSDRYSYDAYQRERRRSPPRRGAFRDSRDGEFDRRVYVHNLSYRTSWQDLKDYMRKAGGVEHVRIMEDRYGRSLGCAIVEFSSKEDARSAIKELNDTMFDGRSILVREDREPNDRGGFSDDLDVGGGYGSRGRGRGGGGGGYGGYSGYSGSGRGGPRFADGADGGGGYYDRYRYRSRSRSRSRSPRHR